jgi:hypothetical protein
MVAGTGPGLRPHPLCLHNAVHRSGRQDRSCLAPLGRTSGWKAPGKLSEQYVRMPRVWSTTPVAPGGGGAWGEPRETKRSMPVVPKSCRCGTVIRSRGDSDLHHLAPASTCNASLHPRLLVTARPCARKGQPSPNQPTSCPHLHKHAPEPPAGLLGVGEAPSAPDRASQTWCAMPCTSCGCEGPTLQCGA